MRSFHSFGGSHRSRPSERRSFEPQNKRRKAGAWGLGEGADSTGERAFTSKRDSLTLVNRLTDPELAYVAAIKKRLTELEKINAIRRRESLIYIADPRQTRRNTIARGSP